MKRTILILLIVAAAALMISCEDGKKTKKFWVNFNMCGGNGSIENQEVADGGKAAMPSEKPLKSNGVFVYWSKDKKSPFDFESPVTEDTTLYAVYKTIFNIGETGPAGGIIFYDAGAEKTSKYKDLEGKEISYTWRYLEMAKDDAGCCNWGNNKNHLGVGENIERRDGIGDGRYTTTKLARWVIQSGIFYNFDASMACYNSGKGTIFNDWFLPSVKELREMYNRKQPEYNLRNDSYWSSSSADEKYASVLDFSSGKSHDKNRNEEHYVRAVRAF